MKVRTFRALLIMLAGIGLLFMVASASAQSGGMRDAEFDGVSFRYDASLAGGVEAKLVPETEATADMAWWMAAPQHIEFDFREFHGSSDKSLPPAIYVYPVRSDYSSLTSGSNSDVWHKAVEMLQQLLSSQPDLRSAIMQVSAEPGYIPQVSVLPPVNAATILTGKAGYLSFQNGIGARYLVQITQNASPPDHDSTLYTFQGLTGDVKYYVAAFFPAFPSAIEPIQPPQGNDIRSYYLNLIDRFDSIANDAYTPNLDNLDKMIGSLSIHPTSISVLPGMPSTGGDASGSAILGMVLLAALMIVAGGLMSVRRSG